MRRLQELSWEAGSQEIFHQVHSHNVVFMNIIFFKGLLRDDIVEEEFICCILKSDNY